MWDFPIGILPAMSGSSKASASLTAILGLQIALPAMPTSARILSVAETPAAVDGEHAAGDEFRFVAAQKHRGIGAIVRRTGTGTERLLRLEERDDGRVAERPLRHRRGDE